MGNRAKQIAVALGAASAALALGQWTPAERKAIDETLRIGNLSEKDLTWDRRPFNDPFRLSLVDKSLDQPIESSDLLMRLSSDLMMAPVGRALRIIDATWPDVPTIPSAAVAPAAGKWTGPETLREPILKLTEQISIASQEVRAATSELSDEERRQLIESLPSLMAEEFTPKLDFVKQKPLALGAALPLLKRIDQRRIVRAAGFLSDAVEEATRTLAQSKVDLAKPLELRLYGSTVRIFGRGSDIHTETDASLTIDLGGDDVYRGRHGAGVGYASVCIDLGNGNDVYEPKDLSIGAGLLGIGIARDEGGDDTYRTGSLSLGCGMGGVGVFTDAYGDDHYRSKVLSQGFAAFGIGLLIDAKGSDFYDIELYGQGAGRTQGVGVLIDREGRDVYRAGGNALNTPLFTDVNYSFAQGMGMGFREDTGGTSGGVGMLLDGAGDDAYLAETYAQAASYWFGLGVLYDRSGNDTYVAYHYAQSSAMHLTAAYLFDLAGDDAYSMKFGAGHAIGHDYGVAVLLDRAGNDVYSARDSNPSVGNANGLGLFVDAAGDDRYSGPPGRGNAARGSGSLGIFVDMSGQDRYREGLADSNAAVSDSWGVAYDFETPRIASTSTALAQERPVPGSLPRPTDAELDALYRKATQWGVGSAQAEVESAIGKLIGIGLPAFEWMLDNRLARADRLQIRAFTAVIGAVGSPAKEKLAEKAAKGNLDEKRNALSIAVDGRVMELAPIVPSLIDNPSLRLQAVRAAGTLGSRESVDRLIPLTRDLNNLGLAATVALAEIGDERAYATGEVLLVVQNLPVRRAAMALLAKFPLRASETAVRLLGDTDERKNRLGIELLGAIGTPEALSVIAERLLDPSPGIRIQSLIALNGRCPEEKRLTLISLRNDPDPAVRAIAMRIDPGR